MEQELQNLQVQRDQLQNEIKALTNSLQKIKSDIKSALKTKTNSLEDSCKGGLDAITGSLSGNEKVGLAFERSSEIDIKNMFKDLVAGSSKLERILS